MPISTQHLAGGYPNKPVLQQINLSLEQGEWLTLLGANGSGKSTLLKLISRILPPQQGRVLLDGVAIHTQPAREVAQKLAILPQQPTLPEGLTVRQLVSLGRTPHQSWWQWELTPNDRAIVESAMARTQLAAFVDRPVEQLSGGERQRAFLALALAQNPQVLLLDEPTTFLDIRYQLELLELLKQLNQQQNLALITVLHDINLAARYSDRLALLYRGQIWDIGTPKEVLTSENLVRVFGVDVAIVETPVGLQVCPLNASGKSQSL
jgi:iron complex transport system ATP-binding protein